MFIYFRTPWGILCKYMFKASKSCWFIGILIAVCSVQNMPNTTNIVAWQTSIYDDLEGKRLFCVNKRAARFAELNDQWKLQGEIPPYRAGLLLLWVLWFIDDSVLLFRNAAQMTHLMPSVLTLFGSMGLRISMTKSCILGARCRLPGTLFGAPIVGG